MALEFSYQTFKHFLSFECVHFHYRFLIIYISHLSDQQSELNDLLDGQRENELGEAERLRLESLMQVYRRSLVRKAQAIKVAVERRLMAPLG